MVVPTLTLLGERHPRFCTMPVHPLSPGGRDCGRYFRPDELEPCDPP